MPTCPKCESSKTVKNGQFHNGKQRFLCYECGRQFVENPTQKLIDPATRDLIDRLFKIRISLAGIARVVQVSEQWLQAYVNQKYAQVPRKLQVQPKKKGKLTIQCDQLWSFVDNKGNKQWVWLAMEVEPREIIGVYIGSRDEEAARHLWQSLPGVDRQCAIASLIFGLQEPAVLPSKRPDRSGKRNRENELH
jgi:transposase-like protein